MFEKRPKLSFFILGMFFGALSGGIIVYYNSVITNENKISVNLIPQIVKQVIGVINNKSENSTDTLSNKINNEQNKCRHLLFYSTIALLSKMCMYVTIHVFCA